jgi:hypothetical protein
MNGEWNRILIKTVTLFFKWIDSIALKINLRSFWSFSLAALRIFFKYSCILLRERKLAKKLKLESQTKGKWEEINNFTSYSLQILPSFYVKEFAGNGLPKESFFFKGKSRDSLILIIRFKNNLEIVNQYLAIKMNTKRLKG